MVTAHDPFGSITRVSNGRTGVVFLVYGRPQPAGSKRAFPVRRKNGSIGVAVTEDNPRSHDWKGDVATAAADAMVGGPLLDGPLALAILFTLTRPKGHYGTGRNVGVVKPNAPEYPTTKPDATKLLRAVEDALSGIVWRDDAQVVAQEVTKVYCDRTEPEGAYIRVWPI
jgi:Holliday junction resolvase RusA-like endonuclease